MTRDYTRFFPPLATQEPAQRELRVIDRLGWGPFFARQLSVTEMNDTPPVRVIEVHRNALHVLGDDTDTTIPPIADVTVGDWLLYKSEAPHHSKPLERRSLLKRRAPGADREVQLIAANINTAFIVTSCNQDFNIARLERYIALILEAGITPVILLTKTDLVDDTQSFIAEAEKISELVAVIALDARGAEPGEKLQEWCKPGQTIAFLGSSGVGKSTLTNALCEQANIATQAIRTDDAKGRHTTTRRQLHIAPGGFAILDTPGMRELQLTDAAAGIEDLFADLNALSSGCRFNDCRHETEPGCAVLGAVENGEIDPERLARWRKLKAEDAFNSASLSERRAKDRSFGKTIRQTQKLKRKRE